MGLIWNTYGFYVTLNYLTPALRNDDLDITHWLTAGIRFEGNDQPMFLSWDEGTWSY